MQRLRKFERKREKIYNRNTDYLLNHIPRGRKDKTCVHSNEKEREKKDEAQMKTEKRTQEKREQ